MDHLKENNITYFAHMFFAMKLSMHMLWACVKCFIHAIFPGIFITAATDLNNCLDKKLNSRK
jgi:hypothetical protein